MIYKSGNGKAVIKMDPGTHLFKGSLYRKKKKKKTESLSSGGIVSYGFQCGAPPLMGVLKSGKNNSKAVGTLV
ncbi:hypothetical protein CROQUDRAFT_349618 [Cronartium quercuum f. sp. fusiforme G11]|uniref:Uncharacterized protein n=1 Tax=Cronartium quercuum f. sp. fusiforme G11 TaxID=708437 RepID=A0A9P6TER5_9BASI|nr:hypothetical protein CROQUDRAFT_349618 [Cronartium quercuum f. sp. fusiforme G11]